VPLTIGTYQEALLSRRRLVFTDTQVYFQCRSEHYLEGLATARCRPDFTQNLRAFPRRGVGSESREVYDRLEEYYRRNVSYDTDIINAFLGIFQAFPDVTHFYGIPILRPRDFNGIPDPKLILISMALSLAWRVDDCHNTKPCIHTPQVSRNPHPSWTWAVFKASQTKSNQGRLLFEYYITSSHHRSCELETIIQIRMCHSSGVWMSLYGYICHLDDYTAFLPQIEITSTTITGSLLHGQSGSVALSTCPKMALVLQQWPEDMPGEVTAVCVGQNMEIELVFILVEALSDSHYRRIGISTLIVEQDLFREVDIDLWKSRMDSDTTKYDFALQKLCYGGPWRRKTILLV
jgi:hypothetical protein